MAPGKARVGLAGEVLGRRKSLGRWNRAERQAFPEQYLVDFHLHHHPLPIFFITASYFFPTQHIFPVILFSCLLDYTSQRPYECSGMSVFFPHVPNTQQNAWFSKDSINFCWINMHTQTCIHTYVLMGTAAHRQGCEHHMIQKFKISQSLQVSRHLVLLVSSQRGQQILVQVPFPACTDFILHLEVPTLALPLPLYHCYQQVSHKDICLRFHSSRSLALSWWRKTKVDFQWRDILLHWSVFDNYFWICHP